MDVSTPTTYPKSGKRMSNARGDNQQEVNWETESKAAVRYPNPGIRGYSDYKFRGTCSGNGAGASPESYPQRRRSFGTEKSL